MKLHTQTMSHLAQHLLQERRRQALSREQLAGVCNVSPSFIRDAESNPGRCSLDKLLQLTQGLGLTVTVNGWPSDEPDESLANVVVKAATP